MAERQALPDSVRIDCRSVFLKGDKNMSNMIFRYADKSKFAGEWDDAPIWEVQTIAYVSPVTGDATLAIQGDYYWISEDGSIIAGDAVNVLNEMRKEGINIDKQDTVSVTKWAAKNGYKIGITVGFGTWQEIQKLGSKDRNSLRK
ncbi:MAG: hypothetical protein ACYS6W_17520 [Planctomycetota bacterium]|jgi:hypothetical protein